MVVSASTVVAAEVIVSERPAMRFCLQVTLLGKNVLETIASLLKGYKPVAAEDFCIYSGLIVANHA